MCGLGAIFQQHKISEKNKSEGFIQSVINTLHSRGPDGNGVFSSDNFQLFHTWLKIMDLSELAKQPMFTEDQNCIIVFNGEIYNYVELKDKLIKKHSIRFHTESDTEVLLKGLRECGPEFIKELNGDFAFVFIDLAQNRCVVARDRFGIKPLYCYKSEDKFLVASRMDTLFQLGAPKVLEPSLITDYLVYRYSRSDKTPYKNIFRFPTGTYWEVGLNKLDVIAHKYWDTDFFSGEDLGEESLGALFENGVKIRLRGKAAPSIFLSGGIDSSYISSFLPKESRAYFYDVKESPDRDYVNTLVQNQGFLLETIAPSSDREGQWKRALGLIEEPIGDSILTAHLDLFSSASHSSKVALSGEGADEIFGGYAHQQFALFWQSYLSNKYIRKTLSSFPLEHLLGMFSRWNPYPIKIDGALSRKFRSALSIASREELYNHIISLFSDEEAAQALGLQIAQTKKDNHLNAASFFEYTRQKDLNAWLSNYGLLRQDKLGLGNGLEIRVPYLDHRFVEAVNAKYMSISDRQKKNKNLLRKISSQKLPLKVLNRKKFPFFLPDNLDLKSKYLQMAESILAPERLKKTGILDPQFVTNLIKNEDSSFLKVKRLGSLMALQIWLESN